MITDRQSDAEKYVSHIRDHLPEIFKLNDEGNREAVQTSVWMVGLATSFLAVLAAKPEVLSSLAGLRRPLVGALLGVAVFGVLQRMIQMIASRKERFFAAHIRSYLWAVTTQLDDPWELKDWWSVDDIVQRLKSDFGVDYTPFPVEQDALAKAREYYAGSFQIWQDYEKTKQARFDAAFAAMQGKEVKDVKPHDGDPIKEIRDLSSSYGRWIRASGIALLFVGGLFIASTAMLAAALFRVH